MYILLGFETFSEMNNDRVSPGRPESPEGNTGPAREVSLYLCPSRLCTSLFPGARTPTVPSPPPTSARSPLLQQRLVQASGTERPHGRYLRRYLAPSPKNSRIPLSCAATGATRSTTNALPTRLRIFSISFDVSTRGALHALSRRVSLPSTSIEPARIEYIHQEHTSNVCICVHVCVYARMLLAGVQKDDGSVSATAYNCGRGKVIRTRKGRSLQLCCFFSYRDMREAIAG